MRQNIQGTKHKKEHLPANHEIGELRPNNKEDICKTYEGEINTQSETILLQSREEKQDDEQKTVDQKSA